MKCQSLPGECHSWVWHQVQKAKEKNMPKQKKNAIFNFIFCMNIKICMRSSLMVPILGIMNECSLTPELSIWRTLLRMNCVLALLPVNLSKTQLKLHLNSLQPL